MNPQKKLLWSPQVPIFIKTPAGISVGAGSPPPPAPDFSSAEVINLMLTMLEAGTVLLIKSYFQASKGSSIRKPF